MLEPRNKGEHLQEIFADSKPMEWAEHLVQTPVSNIIPHGGAWGEVDGPTLLAAASSLQPIPANVHFLTQLQRLAAAAARLPARPQAPSGY